MWHISGCSPSQQTIENEGFGRDPPTNDLDGHPGCRCCTDGKTSPTHIPAALPARELAAYGPTPTKWQKQKPSSKIPFQKLCKKSQDVYFLGILIHGLLLMLPRNHWGSRDLFPRSFSPKMLTSLLLLEATVVAVASEVSCSTWRSSAATSGWGHPKSWNPKKNIRIIEFNL